MNNTIKLNSPKAWLLAARPKTLTGAAVPVMIGTTLAMADNQGNISFIAALLCLLFAFIMQIDANLVNDYFDFLKGTDDEKRLGPKRACAQGWVTPSAMRWAILVTTLVACLVGLPLVLFGGWTMVAVGAFCVLFCFLYTTHLSYIGLGDLLVLLFFGLVPVCLTYLLAAGGSQADGAMPAALSNLMGLPLIVALACGLVVDTLLVVNNYRDIEGDRRSGKRTLIVLIGHEAATWLYLALGFVPCIMGAAYAAKGYLWPFIIPLATYLPLHIITWRSMKRIGRGKALNHTLAQTARNIFVYGLAVAVGLLIHALCL